MSDFDDLFRAFLKLQHTVEELRHQAANTMRVGTIKETDGKKGYQVDLGNDDDGKSLPSAWFPHPEQGGAFKTWRPMSKGQIVYVIAPGGDQRQAFIIPKGGFSDENPQPSEKLDENVETFGKVRVTWAEESTKKEVGDKVSVTTTTESSTVKTENAGHVTGKDTVTASAGASTHTVDPKRVVADASLFRATRKVILASG